MSPRERYLIGAALAGFLMIGVGCGDSESTTPQVSGEDVKQEMKEATETAAAYTEQEMQAFGGEVEARLQTMDQKMDALQSKIGELQGEARQALEQQMQNLQAQRRSVAEDLEELKTSSAAAWKDLRAGLQSSLERLGEALAKAEAEFQS